MKRSWVWRAALALGAAIAMAGCGAVKIGKILDEPTRYQNKTVHVDGRVDSSFSAVVAGVYQVDDNTGKIYVLSNGGAPRKGARVSVKGQVINGITVGSRTFGTAIREEHHRVHY